MSEHPANPAAAFAAWMERKRRAFEMLCTLMKSEYASATYTVLEALHAKAVSPPPEEPKR